MNILKSIVIGIGIASSIMLLFVAKFNIQMGFQDVFGLYLFGAVCGFLPIVYATDRLPLPLKLLVHFGGSIIAFFTISSINHWVPLKVESLIGAAIIFTLIFLAIWFVFFMINIKQSEQINTKIKETHK
ncbi:MULTISPECIES: DUF3021 domain-containing protein [unclassified Staphylococcus]|uniref:DUF3021 domain-containing protein n=1 Tax=unclassified Staphylococcus TaxID=91994 RepID=UPI0021D1F9F5|nr:MULTISPECIES: DUF3021 domain-containing protein [unclassified Staphylococcus]UXR78446.1 DUF3021 domain-containing protein [Staphylococcus sp. IVB6227]UXR82604.1 DUF3021 domain-containing protein [Staphylococcus sp. IVB6214]